MSGNDAATRATRRPPWQVIRRSRLSGRPPRLPLARPRAGHRAADEHGRVEPAGTGASWSRGRRARRGRATRTVAAFYLGAGFLAYLSVAYVYWVTPFADLGGFEQRTVAGSCSVSCSSPARASRTCWSSRAWRVPETGRPGRGAARRGARAERRRGRRLRSSAMRVCFVLPSLGPSGGVSVATGFARALRSRHGVEVEPVVLEAARVSPATCPCSRSPTRAAELRRRARDLVGDRAPRGELGAARRALLLTELRAALLRARTRRSSRYRRGGDAGAAGLLRGGGRLDPRRCFCRLRPGARCQVVRPGIDKGCSREGVREREGPLGCLIEGQPTCRSRAWTRRWRRCRRCASRCARRSWPWSRTPSETAPWTGGGRPRSRGDG